MFWTTRMKELHEEELRVNILEIYRKLCLSPPDMRRESRKNPELKRRSPESRKRSPDTRRRSRDRRLSPEPRRRSPDYRRDRRSVFSMYNFIVVPFLSVIMISNIVNQVPWCSSFSEAIVSLAAYAPALTQSVCKVINEFHSFSYYIKVLEYLGTVNACYCKSEWT